MLDHIINQRTAMKNVLWPLFQLGRACHAFDCTPDARVEGNQDSPCLVRLPNFRGVCG